MKVRYLDPDGHESCAYLVDQPDEHGYYHGENKYTDEPVVVWWNEAIEQWLEVVP